MTLPVVISALLEAEEQRVATSASDDDDNVEQKRSKDSNGAKLVAVFHRLDDPGSGKKRRHERRVRSPSDKLFRPGRYVDVKKCFPCDQSVVDERRPVVVVRRQSPQSSFKRRTQPS